MIKLYQVPLLARTVAELKKEQQTLKRDIEQGDMQAVQKLSELKAKVLISLDKISGITDKIRLHFGYQV